MYTSVLPNRGMVRQIKHPDRKRLILPLEKNRLNRITESTPPPPHATWYVKRKKTNTSTAIPRYIISVLYSYIYLGPICHSNHVE